MIWGYSTRHLAGTRIEIGRPVASTAAYPHSCSATAFQLVMIPWAEFVRIASLEHDTTAANRRCASRASGSIALSPVALTARLGPPNVLERRRTRRDGAVRRPAHDAQVCGSWCPRPRPR